MLAIYGCGGMGRDLLAALGAQEQQFCFVSDRPAEIGSTILGVPVHSLDELCHLKRTGTSISVVISVSGYAIRRQLAERICAAKLPIGSAIAPTAIVGPDVSIGEGAVLCHHSIITVSTRIGRHFHANTFASVAHDCIVGDYVTLAPRVCINGNTVIEDDVYIGTGAILKQGTPERPLRIGKGAVIGMGAVVTRDVPPGATVVGNPARPLQRS